MPSKDRDTLGLAGTLQPGQKVKDFPTPIISDLLFTEDVDIEGQPNYLPLPKGTPYPDQRGPLAGFRLVQEKPLSHRVNRRWWANDRINQDAYNYSESFVDEGGTFPVFMRQYVVPRLTYVRATDKAAFTGLIRIDVTAGGTGYSPGTTIAITGNATAIPKIVSGVLRAIYLTSEGTGYDSASLPSVTITDTGPGAGATAISVMQPKAAVLIKEDMKELPTDDPRHSDSVQVIRVYETLPGPTLTSQNAVDSQAWGGASTTIGKAVVSGTTPTAGAFNVLESTVQAESANVSRQQTKTIDGGGWPQLTEFHVDSQSGIIIRITKQMVDAAVVSGISLTAAPGTSEGSGTGTLDVLAPGLILTPVTSSSMVVSGSLTPNVTGTWSLQNVTYNGAPVWLFILSGIPYFMFYTGSQWNVGTSFSSSPLWFLISGPGNPGGIYTIGTGTGTFTATFTPAVLGSKQIEHQPFDEYRTIQLISEIGQLPDPENYPDVVQISLPSILNSAEVNEAWAFTSDKQSNSAALQKNITTGYSGPANATIYRSYSFGPPVSIPNVTAWKPEEDSLFWYWFYFNTDNDFVASEARTFEFPPTLHSLTTVTIGGSDSGAGNIGSLQATSPTGYSSGDTFVHAAKVEKQQMGIYLLEYAVATIP